MRCTSYEKAKTYLVETAITCGFYKGIIACNIDDTDMKKKIRGRVWFWI